MALIFDARNPNEPGVHAILIGVGSYPYMRPNHPLGQFAPEAGLEDLESPLHSVEAFAAWLRTDLDIPGTPLRSLRVLGSSPTRTSTFPVGVTTFANIQREVRAWFDDVDTNAGNLAVFYFIGHGLAAGAKQALLAEDFGSDRHAPFDLSLDPDQFASAVRKAKAQRQLFLIDACSREVPLGHDYEAVNPRPIIQAEKHANLPLVKQSFLRASAFGTRAFGRRNGPSLFMEAFLKAMRGGAAVNVGGGRWVVQTDMLRTVLSRLIEQSPDGQGQEVSFGGINLSSILHFHQLPGEPLVPVEVTCNPEDFQRLADLHIDAALHCSAGTWPLNVEVAKGEHDFSAIEPLTAVVHGSAPKEYIHPPFGVVSIPCGETS